ncbi:MAG: signal peptidase I [Clostridia bacterium]
MKKQNFDSNRNQKAVIVLCIIIIISLAINVIQFFAFSLVKVRGNSMSPTYQSGDYIIVNKIESNISRNDVVMLYYNGNKIIKRIVGVEGDCIEMRKSQLYINGLLDLKPGDFDYSNFSYILSENEFFVVGDNYEHSYDSRNFGRVMKKDIIGVV